MTKSDPKELLILAIIKQALLSDKSYLETSEILNKHGYNYTPEMVETLVIENMKRSLN